MLAQWGSTYLEILERAANADRREKSDEVSHQGGEGPRHRVRWEPIDEPRDAIRQSRMLGLAPAARIPIPSYLGRLARSSDLEPPRPMTASETTAVTPRAITAPQAATHARCVPAMRLLELTAFVALLAVAVWMRLVN